MKRSLPLFFVLLITHSCIDRAEITGSNQSYGELVVDGLVTDEPGPYTVKLFRSSSINSSLKGNPVSSAKVTMQDNVGNSEEMVETKFGTYETQPNGMRGVIGREYSIRIETRDGKIFESVPDRMAPAGELVSLYYKFESFKPENSSTMYGYRVYIDSQSPQGDENYFRWRFSGTYIVETLPGLLKKRPPDNSPVCSIPLPLECSGWVVIDGVLKFGYEWDPRLQKFTFQKDKICTCCKCWVTQYEDRPHVSNNQFVASGKNIGVEVGYVPVNYYTFQEKYRLEVKQMSLSNTAYNYWKLIQSQKEGASGLFQPPTGKARTNIFEINNTANALGIFYAAAVNTKQVYIKKEENKVGDLVIIPIDCAGRAGPAPSSCLELFPNSTTLKPADWR